MSTTGYVIIISLSVFDFLVRGFSIYKMNNPDSEKTAIALNFLMFILINALMLSGIILWGSVDNPCPQLEKVENVYKIK